MKHTVIIRYLPLLVSALLIVTVSCRSGKESLHDEYRPDIQESTIGKIQFLYKNMQHDSLTAMLKPLFYKSLADKNTELAIFYGSHLAQVYQLLGMLDSASRYLHILEDSLPENRVASYRENVLNIISGNQAIMSYSDYATALEYYQKGYDISKSYSDVHGMGVSLASIVYVFYILADEYGMRYAQQLYRLTMTKEVDYMTAQNAYIALAQMYYIQENPTESYKYLCMADSISQKHGIHYNSALVSMIHGDICCTYGEYAEADSCYNAALENAYDGDQLILPLIYLSRGKLFYRSGDYGMAAAYLRKGIDASYLYHNAEVRYKLLQLMSDLYYDAGKKDSSLTYYMRMRDGGLQPRSISEINFSNLLLEYQQMEYEHELQSKDLKLAKANQHIILATSAVVVAFLLSLSLSVTYRRKQNMYKALVTQYENMLSRSFVPGQAKAEEKTDRLDYEKELFKKIDSYMVQEKAWRKKNMSLDTLAEIMNTNRTYVSNAINHAGNMTFAAYVNMYRIRDAAEIISEDRTVLLKQLADMVGFTSPTLFSKSFYKETGVTPTQYKKTISSVKDREQPH